jgi:CRISPR/Cas system CSM-associated protein Csm3 (group 7 of RAMP superfamily)
MTTVPGTLEVVVSIKTNKTQYFVNYANLKGKTVRMILENSAVCFLPADAKGGEKAIIALGPDQKPIKVTIDGKPEVAPRANPQPERPAKPSPKTQTSQNSRGKASGFQNRSAPSKATAPYNFVPYDPGKVVRSNFNPQAETYTGTITCRLEAKTPFLVASGVISPNEDATKLKRFLRIGEADVIPGSSFRGLFRSIVELLSYSPLTPINANNLYYRNFTDNKWYSQLMGDSQAPRQKVGWLTKKGFDYYVYPTRLTGSEDPAAKPVAVNKILGKDKNDRTIYYFAPMSTAGPPIKLERSIIDQFVDQLTVAQYKYLPERCGVNSVSDLQPNRPLPVFYVEEIGVEKIFFIGLPMYFRVPYKFRPASYVIIDDATLESDFARMLFGYTSLNGSRKGRLSFSHAKLSSVPESAEGHTVTLGQPNVTCLGHYLTQNKTGRLYDYNRPDARIRGRKLYWHRSWDANPEKLPQGNKNTDNVLFPIGVGSSGQFKVQVSQVSLEELGATFLALELWPESCHKLGLGKPIGLGSVKVTIEEIDVELTRQRYRSLIARLEKKADRDNNDLKEKALKAFKAYVCQAVSPSTAGQDGAYELLPEIKAFRAIVDFENRPSNEATNYLKLEEFKKKAVLPDILSIYRP